MRAAVRVLVALACTLAVPAGAAAETVRDYYDSAMEFLDQGEYDRALQLLERAVRMAPRLPQVHNALGIVHLHRESYEIAESALEQAIALDPAYAEAYYNLGTLYSGMSKDPDRALQYYEKTLALDPAFAKAYFGSGWVYLNDKHDSRKALEMFRKAVELTPDHAEAQFGLGMTYAALGDRAAALKPLSLLRSMNREELAASLEQALYGEGAAGQDEKVAKGEEGS